MVFKPSEYTPGAGQWLADKFTVVAVESVFQVVTGLGETGNALCTAAVNEPRSPAPARPARRLWPCAENLTPVLIEAGGKDSLIVDDDDLTKAAEAALWGGMSNAGQTCIGTERVYVHETVFDAFINEITSQAKMHAGPDGKIGPITNAVAARHHQEPRRRTPVQAPVVLGGADAVRETDDTSPMC